MATSSRRNGIWTSDLEIVDECDELDKKVYIHMPTDIYNKIAKLMEEINRTEWMGYFLGEREDNHAYIEELEIPEQRVSSVSAQNTELASEDPIGVIHSHHSMGASSSHTDDENLAQEGFSIVVDDDLSFDVDGRVELPCGKMGKVDAKIKIENTEVDDEFVEDVQDKLNEVEIRTKKKSKSDNDIKGVIPLPTVQPRGAYKFEDYECPAEDCGVTKKLKRDMDTHIKNEHPEIWKEKQEAERVVMKTVNYNSYGTTY